MPSDDDLGRLSVAMADAGRDVADLEMVGRHPRRVPRRARRPLRSTTRSTQIPAQVARGFGTICIKPSQFTDDRAEIPALLRRIVEGVEARCG